jgi:hypothetical protein
MVYRRKMGIPGQLLCIESCSLIMDAGFVDSDAMCERRFQIIQNLRLCSI